MNRDPARDYLVFALDQERYGLPISAVERVLPAAAPTPLPESPAIVTGALDYRGRILPVFNLRRRFRLPERPMRLSDVLILAHSRQRPALLHADTVLGLESYRDAEIAPSADLAANLKHVRGVVGGPGGLLVIQDLDAFLSAEEDAALERALSQTEPTR